MELENIRHIYIDLQDVLSNQATVLSKIDRSKLLDAKDILERELNHAYSGPIGLEKKEFYMQMVIWIIEIIKTLSDN